jgi:hypothetical protein
VEAAARESVFPLIIESVAGRAIFPLPTQMGEENTPSVPFLCAPATIPDIFLGKVYTIGEVDLTYFSPRLLTG